MKLPSILPGTENYPNNNTSRPAIGGYLSNPVEHFPDVFSRIQFFKDFPYFLPCLISALYSGAICLIVFLFLKEVCYWDKHTIPSLLTMRQL